INIEKNTLDKRLTIITVSHKNAPRESEDSVGREMLITGRRRQLVAPAGFNLQPPGYESGVLPAALPSDAPEARPFITCLTLSFYMLESGGCELGRNFIDVVNLVTPCLCFLQAGSYRKELSNDLCGPRALLPSDFAFIYFWHTDLRLINRTSMPEIHIVQGF